jgi:heme oxygenase
VDVERLKRETSDAHQAVERAMTLMSPGLQREEYVESLLTMHGIVLAWETAATLQAPQWLKEDLASRSRLVLIEQDLDFFEVRNLGLGSVTLPDITDEVALLGTMYVMEGSALGGQIIARNVEERLSLTDGCGSAFFRGHTSRTGHLWKGFCEILRTRISDDRSEIAIHAALQMFEMFARCMERPNGHFHPLQTSVTKSEASDE